MESSLCAVCLDDTDSSMTVAECDCSFSCHPDCYDMMLKQMKMICPFCRIKIIPLFSRLVFDHDPPLIDLFDKFLAMMNGIYTSDSVFSGYTCIFYILLYFFSSIGIVYPYLIFGLFYSKIKTFSI